MLTGILYPSAGEARVLGLVPWKQRQWTKVLLLTVVPSAFLAHIPVELMRQFDPGMMALLLAFSAGLWIAAVAVFRFGLRRYESGNLMTMRS